MSPTRDLMEPTRRSSGAKTMRPRGMAPVCSRLMSFCQALMALMVHHPKVPSGSRVK